jgi:hypothetical protein
MVLVVKSVCSGCAMVKNRIWSLRLRPGALTESPHLNPEVWGGALIPLRFYTHVTLIPLIGKDAATQSSRKERATTNNRKRKTRNGGLWDNSYTKPTAYGREMSLTGL